EELDRQFGFRTLHSLTNAFVSVAKEKSFPLYYDNEYGVDSDIFTWPGNLTVIDGDFSQGTITMLEKNTTEREMLKTALKLPRSQAIERMTAELTSGYFDETKKALIIYLTDVNSNGVPLELVGRRYGDGKLNLNVNWVIPDDTWFVDYGYRVGFLRNNSTMNKTGVYHSGFLFASIPRFHPLSILLISCSASVSCEKCPV
ncbi:hypothetical protein IT401_00285, partial [Candidatus Nomurabacteria bacterium]|nr:hypothetical protein [Candidatus Nomurabacteria bacterium]